MTSYKLSFRFRREDYSLESRTMDNDRLKQKLIDQLELMQIDVSHVHTPTRNLIKALFKNEIELNKVLTHREVLEYSGFHPILSRNLKTKRTIFCSGFDLSLLQTYDKNDIYDLLEKDDWGVSDIYIMNNNLSFKIEFKTIHQALKFLDHPNTSIGGIKIHQRHKLREINTLVEQCWGCGKLQAEHKSQNCEIQICLYCGTVGHKFYDCTIPRTIDKMTPNHKAMRYCIPCNTTGNHTSLDHSLCPKKKEIIQERIRAGREMREIHMQSVDKDINLIKNVIDQTFNETQSNLTLNKQQTQITTILTMALIDEAFNPGVFQDKLSKECESNGLLPVKYSLEPNTAKEFVKTLSGATDLNSTQKLQTQTIQFSKYREKRRGIKYKSRTPKIKKSTLTKYTRDQCKNTGGTYTLMDIAENNEQGMPIDEAINKFTANVMVQPCDISVGKVPEMTQDLNYFNDISIRSVPEIRQNINHSTPKSLQSLNSQGISMKQLTDNSDLSDSDSWTSQDSDSGLLYKSDEYAMMSSLLESGEAYNSETISVLLDFHYGMDNQ